ncbi:hypothetical protein E2562_022687 [Oryza meyeriana var. granulata]|uniref:Btz domain-containing protein n=1 Tax=Oryza meyeriana var. granulata TaxID=110450 RepID=A0A6G1DZZ0_9ORYZ|nr:hypothetical protein E2562_022687 [Oryza meyeriana var. granulata]KAF0918100.1 hypothetical protein E2562_022687 [Oryza meyeriana var. granulata]
MAEKKAEVVEDEEYESDLDDAPLPAVRRRAAASDDEEKDEGRGATGSSAPSNVAGSYLNSDSDGQGAAEMYDDEVYGDEGSEECDEFEAGGGGVGGEALEDEGKSADEEADNVVVALGDEGKYDVEEADGVVAALEGEGKYDGNEGDGEATGEGVEVARKGSEVEVMKKGSEAQAVPTTGAFYMHDDRFPDQENGRHGSQRRVFGGQKLWYPKDDSVWAHDRFYEMNFHNSPNDSGRTPRGSFRAWGGGRTDGFDHGYLERTLCPSYYHDDREEYKYVPKESRTPFATTKDHRSFLKEPNTLYGNANNYRRVPSKFHTYYDHDDTKNFPNVQRGSHTCYGDSNGFNSAQDGYRGRVSRPYRPHWMSAPSIYSGQYIRCQNEEDSSNAEGGRHPSQTLGFWTEQTLPWKQTSPSNVNSASPSFYHSRSYEELPMIQRRKARPVMFSKLFTSSVRMAHSSLKPQSHPVYRVKAVVPSGRGNTLDSLCTVATEDIGNPALNSSTSALGNYSQYSKSSDQGAGYQERSIHRPVQSTSRVSTQIFCPKPASATQLQSHASSSDEDADTSISPGSINSLESSAVKKGLEKEKVEGASFAYDGGYVHGVTGARGLILGDKGFARPPALLPVLQFSGQHPRGPGGPFSSMTLPRFVAQQQLGGSSEMNQMAWLPIFSNATGPLGATHTPPNLGSYYPSPSEAVPSLVPPRDYSVTEVPVSLMSQEIPGHQLGQRQNKTRRYSEMNFASLT